MQIQRKNLSEAHMKQMLAFVTKYQNIHQKIGALEERMSKMQSEKDELIGELELARSDEEFFMSQLESELGPGRVDPSTLTWVLENKED